MIYCGSVFSEIKRLPDGSIHCVVTSPPYYGLRDYNVDGQIGLESSPDDYVANLVQAFREVRRVLRDDGTCWLVIGDSSDTKHKEIMGIPWKVAFALQNDGWLIRQDIIWSKPNPMVESVKDRCTRSHEYVFLLTKAKRYYFDRSAIREKGVCPAGTKGAKGSKERSSAAKVNSRPPEYKIYDGFRNRRSVWTVNTGSYNVEGVHYATFPEDLVAPMVLAGCPPGGVVLDPFFGAGTVGVVCVKNNRGYIGIELNPDYVGVAEKRIRETGGDVKVAGPPDHAIGCLYHNSNEGDVSHACIGANNEINNSPLPIEPINNNHAPAGSPPEKIDVPAPDVRLLPQTDPVSLAPPVLQQEVLQQSVALGRPVCDKPRKNREVRVGRPKKNPPQRSPEIPERTHDAGEALGALQLIEIEPITIEPAPMRRFCRNSLSP